MSTLISKPSRTVAFALVLLALTGCSAGNLLGGSGAPRDAYDLHASADGPVATRLQNTNLTVETPDAGAAIDTTGILIRTAPTEVSYAADGRWIETAPLMIQTALVNGLERTGGFRYVGRRSLATDGNYALLTSVSDFQADINPDDNTAVIHVRITARLVREDDARIVAVKTFEAMAVSENTRTPTLVAGFDAAGTEVLDQLVRWVLDMRGIRVAAPRAG